MSLKSETALRREIQSSLERQGFSVQENGRFFLNADDREAKRKAHELAKQERLSLRKVFINRFLPIAGSIIPDGNQLDVSKVDPVIIEVKPNSAEEEFFRWWNLVWWSLPYEHAYGRQMRFVVWDNYHHAIIGLIGLQSPILKWAVRDNYLEIPADRCDYWVNQSMSAQRLGAVPPYNQILGGKLIAYLMTCDLIRNAFYRKYRNVKTVMQGRILPARLLFVTTTGAYGKSSIYQRLRLNNKSIAEFIGYTEGAGSFHIPNGLFEDLLDYLDDCNIDVRRGYGSGPSRKLRLIDMALGKLGFNNGAQHGISRAVYLFPYVMNLKRVISENQRPRWYRRSEKELTEYWKMRWALKRIKRRDEFRNFKASEFIEGIESNMYALCSEK